MVVIDVKTDLWNRIIAHCRDSGWRVVYKYDKFDAGIDYDIVILRRGLDVIIFRWNNWLEGEIDCSEERVRAFEELFATTLKVSEPSSLRRSIVRLFLGTLMKKVF